MATPRSTGAADNEGDLVVIDSGGREVIHADGGAAALYVGAAGNEGDVIVRDAGGRTAFHLDSQNALLTVGTEATKANLRPRGNGRVVMHMDGQAALLTVGAEGNEGDIYVATETAASSCTWTARTRSSRSAPMATRATSTSATVRRVVFHMDSNFGALYIGADGNEGDIFVRNSEGVDTIHLDGNSGTSS